MFKRMINKACDKIINTISDIIDAKLNEKLDNIQKSLGRIAINQLKNINSDNINDYEFKIFSQWGEDGIIQYLINQIPIENKIFVEFGVENYKESNTRFLLENNNWSGLVIDGDEKNIQSIKQENLYWRYNLKAECTFINRDNINDIIKNSGISGDIGILSVDIDGNDYWVLEKIDVINPRILIIEYNSLWGDSAKVTVPYDEKFMRNNKHYSNLYYGASLNAMFHLAEQKGYSLVGSNSNANNAFFVRNDLIGNLKILSSKESFVRAKFRESRGEQGNLTFLGIKEAKELLKNMKLYDIEKDSLIKVGDLK